MKTKSIKKLLTGLCLGAALLFSTAAAASAEETLPSAVERTDVRGLIEDNSEAVPRAGVEAPKSAKQTAATTTSVSLKWSASAGATGYEVAIGPYSSTNAADYKVLASDCKSTSVKISKLKPGTVYTVRVRPRDEKGLHAGRFFKGLYTYSEKPVITKVSSVGKVYTFYMKTSAPQNTIDGYHVTYTNLATGKSFARTYQNKYNFSVELKPNIFYKMEIRSYYKGEDGKNHRNPSGLTQYVALQPSLTKKSNTSSSMTVGWKPVAGATSYSVYILNPGSTTYKKLKTTGNLSYTFTGLKKNTNYRVKVIANKGAYRSQSNYYSVITLKTVLR